jgi:hypothetical protein
LSWAGVDFIISKCDGNVIFIAGDGYSAVLSKLTNSEALGLAAELVKLAMPEAKSETVSIM